MHSTEPPAVTVARQVLAGFTGADRGLWSADDFVVAAHRLAAALLDTLAAYDEATRSAP